MEHIKQINTFNRKGDIIPKILGVDIDGVQNDFVQGFFDVYQKYFPNKKVTPGADKWYFYDELDFGGEDARVFFKRTKAETWKYSKPFDGVSKAMRRIYQWCIDNDVILKIVTSQPTPEAQEGAIKWLKDNNIKYDEIVFAKSKNKFQHCDILIDDSHKVLNTRTGDKISIKVNRKWNTDVKSNFNVNELKYLPNSLLDEALELSYLVN